MDVLLYGIMTDNRRIFLNIIATYGRSLYSLACGIFSARWVLMSLGKVDYGLFGVVGALTFFISFLNSMLSSALGRYYAFAIGESKIIRRDVISGCSKECQIWFNVALSIHIVVPIILMAIGYPIGLWVVENILVIPTERFDTCVWVFRLACVSSFIAMINVPFTAMYIAKQCIAELTVYSFVQTTANTIFFYYMATHPGIWLLKYAVWMSLITSVPQIVICLRAFQVFPECRIKFSEWWKLYRIREIGSYAAWQMIGGLGALLRGHGISILINRYFGPSVNASMTIANQVNAHSGTLSNAMQGAFIPAITTAYGAGDILFVRKMVYRVCKFGMLLVLLFLIPLSLELNEVMRLWLKNPPEYSNGLCLCMLLMLLIDKSTIGHMVAVNATGKIALYQVVLGGCLIISFFLAWLCLLFGLGVYSMCASLVVMVAIMACGRLFFAKRLVGLDVRHWLSKVAAPVVMVTTFVVAISYIPHLFFEPSLYRVFMTTTICELSFVPLCWFFVFSPEERFFLIQKIRRFIV